MTTQSGRPLLTTRKLSICHGHEFQLSVPDLQLCSGMTTALFGASGSGKTTLLRALAGRLSIQGQIIYHFKDRDFTLPQQSSEIGRRVHYVGQGQTLLPFRTVGSNLTALATLRGTPPQLARDSAAKLADGFGIAALLDRFPDQISNGQYQRAILARSLVLAPAVIFVDEITSALDPPTALGLLAALKKELAAALTQIIFVTHFVPIARHIADNVLFLTSSGRLMRLSTEEFFCSTEPEIVSFRG